MAALVAGSLLAETSCSANTQSAPTGSTEGTTTPTTGSTTTTRAPRPAPRVDVHSGPIVNGQVKGWGDVTGVTRKEICEQSPAYPGKPEDGPISAFWTTGLVAVGSLAEIRQSKTPGKPQEHRFTVAFANPPEMEGGVSGAADVAYDEASTAKFVAGAARRGDGDVCVAPIISTNIAPPNERPLYNFEHFITAGDTFGPYDIDPATNTVSDGNVFVNVPIG